MLVCFNYLQFILTLFDLRLTFHFEGTQEAAKMLLIQPITGMTMSVLFGSLEIYNKFSMKYILILTNWHGLNLNLIIEPTIPFTLIKPKKHHGCIVFNSIFLRLQMAVYVDAILCWISFDDTQFGAVSFDRDLQKEVGLSKN